MKPVNAETIRESIHSIVNNLRDKLGETTESVQKDLVPLVEHGFDLAVRNTYITALIWFIISCVGILVSLD